MNIASGGFSPKQTATVSRTTVLTVVSGWDYLRGALPLLRGERG